MCVPKMRPVLGAKGIRMALALCLTAKSLWLRGGEGEGEVVGPSRSFLGHNNTVLALAYHDGILYSGGLDHYVQLWDVRSGECVGKLEPSQSDSCMVLRPCVSSLAVNQNFIWMGTIASSLEKWHTQTRTLVSFVGCAEDKGCKLEDMHHGSIDTLLLKQSADSSSVLFSGDGDGMIRMWDADTDQSLGVLEGHTDAIYALLETEEPYSYIVSGSNDGTIRVWSLENLKCLTVLETDDFEYFPAYGLASLGNLLVVSTMDGIIQTWDMSNWNMTLEFTGHRDSRVGETENTSYSRQTPVNALWMARSHRVLVSASADSLVRLWKPGTSFCIMTCKGHRKTIYALTGSLYVPRNGEVLTC